MAKNNEKTKWEGLWFNRQGVYSGKVICRTDIPKFSRLVVRFNKFYEANSNRPKFVYCFASGDEHEAITLERALQNRPYKEDGDYYTEDGERLYTRDEARTIINGTVRAVEYGIHDPYDIIPEDFV